MSEKFLVIGSSSFSGAHFTDLALEEGAEVIGISRSPEPSPVFLPYSHRRSDRFRFVQADLNLHLNQIVSLVHEFRPDYVVNFAAQGMVAQSWDNPRDWMMTNALAHISLHDRLKQLDFIKKYVHASTPEVYGSCAGIIDERAPFNPSTPYAVSKAAADMSLLAYQKAYGFPVVLSRSANVFGPGQQLYRIVPRTAFFIRTGRKLQLHGGGTSVRSFIHIRDVAEGTMLLARKALPSNVFHFSTPEYFSIREIVEEVCRQMGVDFGKHVEVVGDRLGKDAAYTLDSSRAKADLGWVPKRSFKDGVADTVRWIDDNLDDLKLQECEYIHKP
ncbi:MAG: GDP-mannose 4,6-dehydratase [Fibrobacterota bacterium]|nr:GDP-mannose 4,6-dehydratase [Fibrobacterota bacterium]